MAFLVPRDPLTPHHRLALDVDPARRVVRAADLLVYCAAERALAAGREQAQAIVAGAQAAFEAERRRGHEEGTALARREGATHMAEQVVRSDTYFALVEKRLVDLVIQTIRRIVEDYDDRERVLHSVRRALDVVRNQKQITLRVRPEHVDHVRARTGDLLANYPGVNWLDVVADARLASDCCVLESDIGVVEASTEGQLAALEAALRNAQAS